MNTANLQLEGLYLAFAQINHVLVQRGVLTREEIDSALKQAELIALSDRRASSELSPPNRDAVLFPIRFLQLANQSGDDDGTVRFSELARLIGETKS